MAKKIIIPEPPAEFREQYAPGYACFPLKWRERIATLPDEVAGRLLVAVLEHCECGRTTPPEGLDAFSFGFILDAVDEYQERGLQSEWKKKYLAQLAARERWNDKGEGAEMRTDADGCGRVRTNAAKCHNINNTSTSNLESTLNSNPTKTVQDAQARGLAGSVWGPLSGSVDEIKAILKERAKQLTGYSKGQHPLNLDELTSFCSDLGCPDFPAFLLWKEMEFHGWEIQDGEAWRPIKSWQGFVIQRIATEINEAQRNGNIQSQAGGQDWESKLRAQGYQ